MLKQTEWTHVGCAERPLRNGALSAVAWSPTRSPLSWWGLDAAGAPVCLVLDFGLLDLERPPLGGDVESRLARIRARIAEVREEGVSAELEAISELGDYGREAREALDLLLEIAAAEGERDCWDSQVMYAAAAAAGQICEEAPELVAHVVEALTAARSAGAVAGLLYVAYCIRAEPGRPLVPAVLRYLEPGHPEEVQERAWDAMGKLAWVAPETLPFVLQAARGAEGFCKSAALYAITDLLNAGGQAGLQEVLEVLEVLEPVTGDDDSSIHEAQLDLLDRLGLEKPEVAARMFKLLESGSFNVSTHALHRLEAASIPLPEGW